MLAAPGGVAAQAWLSDRDHKVGAGIRTGNLELHPGIGAEAGYQSNVDYRADQPKGSAILRLVPHLFLSTLGAQRTEGDEAPAPPKVTFRGGVSAGLYHYFSVDRDDVPVEFNADADLVLMPERPFSLGLSADAGRSIRWTSPVLSSGSSTPSAQSDFGRNSFSPGARIMLQTRGGILKTEIGGNYRLVLYDEGLYEGNDTNEAQARALTTWSLFPKTALFHETAFNYRTFSTESAAIRTAQNDGWMLTNRIGVNGAVTRTIGTTLAVGYGAGFFQAEPETDDFDDVLLQALLRWSPSERNRWTLGYTRSYEMAFQGNYSRSDRIGARMDAFFGGSFMLGVDGAFTLVSFGADRDPLVDTNGARSDTRLNGGLSGEYRFTDWLALTAALRYEQLISDYQSQITMDTGQSVEWTNVEAWVGVRAFL